MTSHQMYFLTLDLVLHRSTVSSNRSISVDYSQQPNLLIIKYCFYDHKMVFSPAKES